MLPGFIAGPNTMVPKGAPKLITFVGAAHGVGRATQATIALPAGMQQGDLVLVQFGHSQDHVVNIATAGYTEIVTAGGQQESHVVGWKIMGPTPDATVTSGGGTSTGYSTVGIAMVFRGVDQATPIDTARTVAQGATTNPNPPSITTANGGAVVAMAVSGVNDITITGPAGYSNLDLVNDAGSDPCSGAMAWKGPIAAATAEDPAAFGTWSSGPWNAATVALRAA